MTTPTPIGSLEIVEYLEFQRRAWSFQRIGSATIALLVVASLLGLFGSGPLSNAEIASGDNALRVRYERFTRYQTSARLRIEAREGLARDGVVRIAFNRQYVDAIRIQQVMPRPDRVEAGHDGIVFVFRQTSPGASLAVNLDYEPERIGRLHAQVAAGDAMSVGFRQFVYP